MKLLSLVFAAAVLVAGCSRGESIVEPGPSDTGTTTTEPEIDNGDESDSGEVVTDAETTTTTEAVTTNTAADGATSGATEATTEAAGDDALGEPAAVGITSDVVDPSSFVVDEDSTNAAVFTELATSGLVLSLDEQSCADGAAAAGIEAGSSELEAVIRAVQDCATPAAIDDFSAELIVAGGAPLPPVEAACVSSRLQSGDTYQPFWAALLDDVPFDFLIADSEVQNRYLDLYTECVSVGRALGEQVAVSLSAPTVGCIDALYEDREFVRVTIEADLSGNAADQERINDQIAGCLTSDERSGLGLE